MVAINTTIVVHSFIPLPANSKFRVIEGLACHSQSFKKVCRKRQGRECIRPKEPKSVF